ncbi:hypothetical protein PEBR_31575 [Penicillium brasilianum]|uniref:HTH CENPB-type domain-containing protein n=1 Tax=Penicillium brasilianum TaxID=104259 RepID=A0A1S9RFA5_PENBI|nr:hypothetical protein PEBR_31575 [Penicillium brasilianum]
MPPKHPNPPGHRVNPADRLALAIIGLKTGKYTTPREAATQNGVSETTLRTRVKSVPTCALLRVRKSKSTNARPKSLRLTRTEENTLYNWIIDVHGSGRDLDPSSIQDMANTLLSKRSGSHGFRVSKGWVSGYLQFHPDIAAILEQHKQRLQALNLRVTNSFAESGDSRTVCANFLHNTRMYALEQNRMEGELLEKCEEAYKVNPGSVRQLFLDARSERDRMELLVKVQFDAGLQMIDQFWFRGENCKSFLKEVEETEAVMEDTEDLKGEIQRVFGGLEEDDDEDYEDEDEDEDEDEEEEEEEQKEMV